MSEYSYLTATVPGVGGLCKQTPEDFLVEEIPSYLPCGAGEHLYLTIEKRNVTTLEAVRRLSAALRVPEQAIGYAGMKDAAGVTRQTLSLPQVRPEDAAGLKLRDIRIISAKRHTNKLKLGHLKGNRFTIVIRQVADDAPQRVTDTLAILTERGVPNFFGYQRYGALGTSHHIGAAMLHRDWRGAIEHLIGNPEMIRDEAWRTAVAAFQAGDPVAALRQMPHHCRSERDVLRRLSQKPDGWGEAFHSVPTRLKKLYLSAFQSYLFDQLLEQRLDEIDTLRQGDVAFKHVNGACFLVDDPEKEAARVGGFEISATGPLYGTRMMLCGGEPRQWEERILSRAGLTVERFDLGKGLKMEGERRPLRVRLGEPVFQVSGTSLEISFSLPRGSYATSVLREVTKTF